MSLNFESNRRNDCCVYPIHRLTDWWIHLFNKGSRERSAHRVLPPPPPPPRFGSTAVVFRDDLSSSSSPPFGTAAAFPLDLPSLEMLFGCRHEDDSRSRSQQQIRRKEGRKEGPIEITIGLEMAAASSLSQHRILVLQDAPLAVMRFSNDHGSRQAYNT